MPKQYVHRKKPGGFQRLHPGRWVTLDLPATAALAAALRLDKLYARIEWDGMDGGSPGFRVRFRLVRKTWRGLKADPTAYDERTIIPDRENVATCSIDYAGPVRKGETGRPYYWQAQLIAPRDPKHAPINPRITTRYTDFWRLP